MSNNLNAKDNVGSDASNEVEHRHQRHPGCPVCKYNHDHDYHYNPDPDYMWDALCVNVNTLVSVQAQRSTSNCQPHSPPHSVEPQCGSIWPQCGSYMGPKLLTHVRLRFWDHSGWRRVWVQAVARACADAIYLGQFVQSKYIIVINTRLSLFVKRMFWEDPKYGKSNFSFNVLYGRLQQTSLNGQDIPWRCSLAVWSKKSIVLLLVTNTFD